MTKPERAPIDWGRVAEVTARLKGVDGMPEWERVKALLLETDIPKPDDFSVDEHGKGMMLAGAIAALSVVKTRRMN
jgi:hypothetical protein